MSKKESKALIAQFLTKTSVEDAQTARFFLEAFNWDVELAVSNYESSEGDMNGAPYVAPSMQ